MAVDLIGKIAIRLEANNKGTSLGKITGLVGSLAEVVNEDGVKTFVNVLDEKYVIID